MIVRSRGTTWLGYLLKARRGSALDQIKWRLGFFVSAAVVVTLLGEELGATGLRMTTAPFTIVGVALSIFLAFRNNEAYARFWEARQLWGALVNDARNLTREVLTFFDGDEATREARRELQERIVHTTIGFVHALRIHLRDEETWDELDLDEETRRGLEHEHNRPTALVAFLGALLADARRRGFVSDYQHVMLEERLVAFTNIQGGCERIKSTPIPFSHTALTHRITAVYLLGLPFGLYDTVGPFTPLVVLFVAFAFLGLDTIGDEMEDPFGLDPNDLPLKSISTTIEINLRQRLGETDLPSLPRADAHGVLT